MLNCREMAANLGWEYEVYLFFSFVSLAGNCLSVFIDFFIFFFALFFQFLHLICKHFVEMYILGELFLYAIEMLYNMLMFKLNVLYFFNWLVNIAQKQCNADNKFRFNSVVLLLFSFSIIYFYNVRTIPTFDYFIHFPFNPFLNNSKTQGNRH